MNEFNKYLLNANNVPLVALGDDGLAINKTEGKYCSSCLDFNTEKRVNNYKYISSVYYV